MDRLILTYALLGHYKEHCKNGNKGIWELYLPIVKKALCDFFVETDITEIKGQAICEIQNKIETLFEIKFPIPILKRCLSILQEEIGDDTKFVIYKDDSFYIKSTALDNVDALIKETEQELAILESDFDTFCKLYDTQCDFSRLLEFINSMQIEIFINKTEVFQDISNIVPLYINKRKSNKEIFTIISNIYTGGLLSSYLTHEIKSPVTKVELLIDTNFYISLINLNTEDSYTTCQDLYKYCQKMGFVMTILPTTVEQIKILLSKRITCFSDRDYIGTIRVADILTACKRRNLDKTDLETIRDKVEEYLEKYNIVILKPAQVSKFTESAKKK